MTLSHKIETLMELTNLDVACLASAIGAQRYDVDRALRWSNEESFPTVDLKSKVEKFLKKLGHCPDCTDKMIAGGGCGYCLCGYSECL